MFRPLCTLVSILALSLTACGGDDAGSSDAGTGDAGTTPAARGHPFATFTAEQLDDYIEVPQSNFASLWALGGQYAGTGPLHTATLVIEYTLP